jgi:predicted unusual protein kinase regulating ubiquinone biosynthesis (AarF/ABC1/UbiB family)
MRASPRPRWILLAGLAVAAAAVARRRRRAFISSTTRVGRTAELARLGLRTGGSEVVHRARRAVANADLRVELDEAHALRTAEQVVATLGNMRGAMMKLGQMASYLNEGLPEPLRDALAQLQQSAPPMAPELAAGVIEEELGASPDRVFAEWDPVPLAAASIGQVHRAVTPDGRHVAVKVQYPGVGDAIRGDLSNARLLFRGLGNVFPGLDVDPIIDELSARVVEELDYRHEAANQSLFADWWRDHPFIHVPNVVDSLTTTRVLTSDLASGARFDDVVKWSLSERNLAGEAIYRFVFRSMYRLRSFNGDPHPGNYLFRPGGQVTFLDFGLVKHFTDDEIAVFRAMIDGIVVHQDPHEFRLAVARAGLFPLDAPFADEDVADYFRAFYTLIVKSEPLTVSPSYSSELVRRTFDVSGEYGAMMKVANVPPPFVIIQRINLGVVAILGHLGATANWRLLAEETWPWVNGPPSTELGRIDAAWMAEHHPTGL